MDNEKLERSAIIKFESSQSVCIKKLSIIN